MEDFSFKHTLVLKRKTSAFKHKQFLTKMEEFRGPEFGFKSKNCLNETVVVCLCFFYLSAHLATKKPIAFIFHLLYL